MHKFYILGIHLFWKLPKMLEAIELSKKINDLPVIYKLNLKVNPGEIFSLLGSTGAGKTCLINLFMGFIKPDSGKTLVNGLDVAKYPDATKEHIMFIPPNPVFFTALSAIENLEFICSQYNISCSQQKLIECLEIAEISPKYIHDPLATYTLFGKKKLALALAIAKNAKVLLLDEPGSKLNNQEGRDFYNLISRLKPLKFASLITSRNPFLCTDISTHIGVLQKGAGIELLDENEGEIQFLEKLYGQ